jgi:dihydroorotate dehydrogenase
MYKTLRPALFATDPELAHRLALRALALAKHVPQRHAAHAPVHLMGLAFPNRVGLAAGFDKNGEAVDGIARLGFGFIEVGTVTPRPQRGQPRPRVFRLPKSHALINRMGFPNEGVEAVVRRLKRIQFRGVLGVNIGKNADTPMSNAADDYARCLEKVHGVADYVAVNISSPNTQFLRELHAPDLLGPLLERLATLRHRLSEDRQARPPLLLKVSPDLELPSLRAVARLVVEAGWDGLIAVNTTVERPLELADVTSHVGGLSGRPLHAKALGAVSELRHAVGPAFPIVGVGGVESAATARALRSAGADLIQLYTGLIYEGPRLVKQCLSELEGDR